MKKLVFIILAFLPIFLVVTIGIASKVYSDKTYIYVESVVFTDEAENEYPKDKIIRLSPSSTFTLNYKIYPELATNKKVNFYSDNPDLLTVTDEGLIIVADDDYGTAYVILKTVCGSKSIKILINIVGEKVTDITLQKQLNLKVGQQIEMDPDVYPITATNKKIIWATSEPDVGKVDDNGIFTADGVGTTIITATSDDDENIFATCTVNVTESSDIIFISGDSHQTESDQFDLRELIDYVNPDYEDNITYKIISGSNLASLNGSVVTFSTGGMIRIQIKLIVGEDEYTREYNILRK